VANDLLNPQTRADELEERLINFGVRIVRLSSRLPELLQENTLLGRFSELEPLQRLITAKREVQKATPISFTSCALYLRN
jgi:hypothetical protein